MEKTKLRGADLITGVVLIVFGVFVLIMAFQMPMKDSWGGVMNVWFVSPALFPLFIGGGIILLAVNILIHALKNGGLQAVREIIKIKKQGGISEPGIRFLAILLPLFSLVYMNLPRIDFFISILLFLTFFITVFYLDDMVILKKLLIVYGIMMGFLLVIFITGISSFLEKISPYVIDVIGLVLFFSLIFIIKRMIRGNDDYNRKFRHAMIMSVITPLILVPTFRFFLRVPLPKEGGIVDLMYLVYYAVK